jgi:hypothetical protein
MRVAVGEGGHNHRTGAINYFVAVEVVRGNLTAING